MSAEKPSNVIAAIRQIKSGALAPAKLDAADRRQCVAYLTAEGLSVPEMAEMLQVSERTIARDRRAVHEANALEQDPKLAGQVAGRLMVEAEQCIGRIRRASREKESTPGLRVDAEREVYVILCKMTEKLQSLGFLPEAARRVEADVSHRLDGVRPFEELTGELDRLLNTREIVVEMPPEELEQFGKLRDMARRALPSESGEEKATEGRNKTKEGTPDETDR